MLNGVIQSVKMVTNHLGISYKITIEDNSGSTTVNNVYTVDEINLIKILKAVGEYPSTDINSDLTGYEINYDVDTKSKIFNVGLVEIEEV